MNPPTQADIARRLNVSKMTVSRALRGEKSVRSVLRSDILRVAEELGYRPDPEVSRMMTHLRQSRGKRGGQTLGFVWTDPLAEKASSWAKRLVVGAYERAESLGYRLEEFSLRPGGMSARRVAEVMEHRGIRGFVLSPLVSRSRGHLTMPWERFSCVMIGIGYAHPALDRVHHHHFLGMMNSLRQLKREGFRRIGFYAGSQIDQRMFGAWSASFLAHHPLSRTQAEALVRLPRVPTRSDFLAWLEDARPDVVLTAGADLFPWLDRVEAARRPSVALLAWSADHPEVPGLDQQSEVLGATAVEMVVERIHRNERGLPRYPKLVMTAGAWRKAEPAALKQIV